MACSGAVKHHQQHHHHNGTWHDIKWHHRANPPKFWFHVSHTPPVTYDKGCRSSLSPHRHSSSGDKQTLPIQTANSHRAPRYPTQTTMSKYSYCSYSKPHTPIDRTQTPHNALHPLDSTVHTTNQFPSNFPPNSHLRPKNAPPIGVHTTRYNCWYTYEYTTGATKVRRIVTWMQWVVTMIHLAAQFCPADNLIAWRGENEAPNLACLPAGIACLLACWFVGVWVNWRIGCAGAGRLWRRSGFGGSARARGCGIGELRDWMNRAASGEGSGGQRGEAAGALVH